MLNLILHQLMLFEELFIHSFLRNISKLFVPYAFKFQTPFNVQGVQLKAEPRSMESLMNLLFPDITYMCTTKNVTYPVLEYVMEFTAFSSQTYLFSKELEHRILNILQEF